MLECLIMGDSLAVGVNMYSRHQCQSIAHVGWTSGRWDKHYHKVVYNGDIVIISLGTNDYTSEADSRKHLEAIRARISGKKVFWILPNTTNPKGHVKPEAIRSLINEIASGYGDSIMTIPHIKKRAMHPTPAGYREMGKIAGL